MMIVALVAVVWGGLMLYLGSKPTITLPNGVEVIFHSSNKGVFQPGRPGAFWEAGYDHPIPPQDDHRIRRWWQSLRGELPAWLVSRLPAWDYHPDDYPHGLNSSELELRFRVLGDLGGGPNAWHDQWSFFVADENGWESRVPDAFWSDDGRFDRGSKQHSGWLRLGTAIPRHSQSLRVRARSGVSSFETYSETRLAAYDEITLRNPFYEGPATQTGARLPITLPFRDGTITLDEIHRDKVVGENLGALTARFRLEKAGKPMPGFVCLRHSVSDSTGQLFLSNIDEWKDEGSHHTLKFGNAPWSDDPCWRLRLALCRGACDADTPADRVFHFEKLPLPTQDRIELNRSVTQGGITLTLATIGTVENGMSWFAMTGWSSDDPLRHVVLIKEAHDDRGRSRTKHPEHGDVPLAWGSLAATQGPPYSLCLPPDAKWWDLSVVPETVTEVEFKFQAPAVKKPGK